MCKSFVFYEDWLLAAETIEDPVLRCEFLQSIAIFALRGEEVDCSPELRIGLRMVKGQIVRDKEKYNEKVDKRRAAAHASHAGLTKSANAASAAGNANPIGNAKANGNADGNVVISTENKNNISPPPNGEVEGREDYSFYLEQIASISIPEAVSKTNYELQYLWRVLDFGTAYVNEVTALAQRGLSNDSFVCAIQEVNKQFSPHTDFTVIKLGCAISVMNEEYRRAFLAEYQRSKHDPNIMGLLLAKAEYVRRGNKITSLAGLLKARG